MDDESRTTPLGVWRYALSYLRAAQTLDDADPNPWVPSNVTHQCVCQGIELAYKSYLLASGKTVDDLRAVGHSMIRCKNAAVELGFPAPTADHREALEMMDSYYREHEFRYIVTGTKHYPVLGRLLGVGRQILFDAAPAVAQTLGEPALVGRIRGDLSRYLGQTPSA
jgi:hypothetical protein